MPPETIHNILKPSSLSFWDDIMYQLYGITKDTFTGVYEAWRSGLHPEDIERGDLEIQLALKGEKEFDHKYAIDRITSLDNKR